jgi:uncharacterized protein YggE
MSRKSIGAFALAGAIVLALAFVLRPLGPGAAVGGVAAATPVAGDPSARVVNVSGNGQVTITPDIATLTFGVESSGTDLAAAQADNATRTQAVIDRLKGLGIAANDLQTTGYSIQPQYDRDQKLTGYRIVNAVRATVRDLKAVGPTIDGAVNAGANRVSGISFDATNKADATRRAREAAVADARQKAEQYAQLTGSTLGGVMQISETTAGTPEYRTAAAPAAASQATPIEPGEGSLTITVQISYELR